MNRVPVARLGLILGEDGATASRKLFRYLPGPKTHSKNQKYIHAHPKALSLEGWRDGLKNLTRGDGGMEGIPPSPGTGMVLSRGLGSSSTLHVKLAW